MTYLRPLKEKDAVLMLEWMHDEEIQKAFKKNMAGMTLADTIRFCKEANKNDTLTEGGDMHYAIVDEGDEYYGTVSLKRIDLLNRNAEYAISVRKCVQGKGVAMEATRLIIKKGFAEFGLHRIYLNVLSDNERAVRFYEKAGFTYEGEFKDCLFTEGKYRSLKWYGVIND